MKIFLIILIPVVLFSCKEATKVKKKERLTAQEIIDKAIDNSCQGNCEIAQIAFTFRDGTYKSTRIEGKYQLERTKIDGEDAIKDVISNEGLKRYINEIETMVNDSMVTSVSDGVNSVHYFAQLPFGLNDQAVQKKLIGEDSINNNNYFKIEVTFKEEGGGTDFDDVFVYWVHKQDFTVDYLAYSYAVNGGGIRFREAYNIRVIDGIRFVDYNNYKPESKEMKLSDLDRLFVKGKLKLVSKIETENITVSLLN
jgi:hypothetical protein